MKHLSRGRPPSDPVQRAREEMRQRRLEPYPDLPDLYRFRWSFVVSPAVYTQLLAKAATDTSSRDLTVIADLLHLFGIPLRADGRLAADDIHLVEARQ